MFVTFLVAKIQENEAMVIVSFWQPIFAYFEANPNPVFMEIFKILETHTITCLEEILYLFSLQNAP